VRGGLASRATNGKDLAAGALLVLVGGVFALDAWMSLRVGSLLRMGPGFFPLTLGSLLAVIGLVIAARSLRSLGTPFGPVPWRAVVLLSLAPLLAAFLMRGLGLLPTVAIAAFAAAQASRSGGPSLRAAIALSLGLAVFCTLLFGFALKLPIRIVGPWIGG
jgi:hypothetical protein